MTDLTPGPELDLELIKQRLEAARNELSGLCKGRRFVMSIPARPDYDSDLLIGAALSDTRTLIEEVERLNKALEDRACDYELLEIAAHNFHTLATFPAWSGEDCRLCRYTQEGHAADCPYGQADEALRGVLTKEEAADDNS